MINVIDSYKLKVLETYLTPTLESEQKEYNLYKQIQQAIEKAEKWDIIDNTEARTIIEQNKSLQEENARLKGELEVRTHQFDTTYLLKKHLQNQIHKLKEELSITQKAFRECSQSEMSCRESLPLARKKIDELYTEIQNLKSQVLELTERLK